MFFTPGNLRCLLRSRGHVLAGTVLTILVVSAHAADAAAASRTILRPAAGRSGETVTLRGERFAPGRRVVVRMGSRSFAARTSRAGAFMLQLPIPASARRPVRIVTGSGKRQIVSLYEVRGATPQRLTTELALGARTRIRYAPDQALAGAPLRVNATGLGARTRFSLRFGDAKREAFRASRSGTLRLRVAVPSLAPGATGLSVRTRNEVVPLPFTILSDPRIAAAGDIACAPGSTAPCKQQATSDLLLRLSPQAVLALGDVQYEAGELPNFMHVFDPSWGRLKNILYPAIGNHEYGTSSPTTCGYACGYFDYFDGVGNAAGPAGRRGEGFYAFDVGAWRLYAVNSNCARKGAPGCTAGGVQETWLRRDLAEHPTRCALMFMHHPLFTSDTRDFDNATFQGQLRPLWQAFYDAGGDIVLTGHSHFYERFVPQNPIGQPDSARGIRQFIVGTGGRNVYGFGTIEPNSEVRDGKTFGVLQLTLHAGSYDWSFVPAAPGTFTDSGNARCHE